VVLGAFSGPPHGYEPNPNLDPEYVELTDGLQRFSAGTALLMAVFERVLDAHAPYAAHRARFPTIEMDYSSARPVAAHNDHQLLNHPRHAIREQYSDFRSTVFSWVEGELDERAAEFADAMERLFVQRPVAEDVWDGFTSTLQVMETFLGLNTVRVDLGPVDLMRAQIVVRATEHGWTGSQVDAFENDFTETFTRKGKADGSLLPFVNAALKSLRAGGAFADVVFPSWSSRLAKSDVDDFLEFVGEVNESSDCGYLNEIKAAGAIPFGVVLAHYWYCKVTKGTGPTFTGAHPTLSSSDEEALRRMLRGTLRSLLAKRLGYQSESILESIRGSRTLEEIADSFSVDATSKPLATAMDLGWIKTHLETVDVKAAKRVFNAMLLPTQWPYVTAAFDPLSFGAGKTRFAVDHIFAEGALDEGKAGYLEGKRIRNLAPLPGSQNSAAKASTPSIKLVTHPGTFYGHPRITHDYCRFLLDQGKRILPADLDAQEQIVTRSSSKLGDERVEFIAHEIAQRV
jgi:hypothetical protein